MKIATVLSLSAVFALTTLVASVGCSAPPPDGKDGKSSAQQKEGDDDNDDGDSADKKQSPASTTTKPSNGETPSATGSEEACDTCLAGTPKMGLVLQCEKDAKDDAAAEKCFTDVCGTDEETSVCNADFDTCKAQCAGVDGEDGDDGELTPDEEAALVACLAKIPKAKAADECEQKCNNEACADKCWEACDNDQACSDAADKCFGDD
ncbi:MAG: hypothetical protein KIT84_24955 [Labilithrix sp.]|nr:hypothetical protein [Labilithrix sp.]MCW5814300.1 hypothetical protein [Labilithrix sp.]